MRFPSLSLLLQKLQKQLHHRSFPDVRRPPIVRGVACAKHPLEKFMSYYAVPPYAERLQFHREFWRAVAHWLRRSPKPPNLRR